jgi:hypothetical protein
MLMTANWQFSRAGYGDLLDVCLPTKPVSFAKYKPINLDEPICNLSNLQFNTKKKKKKQFSTHATHLELLQVDN